MVILNLHDGPGAADRPDTNYAREIPKLNACANVCTVGYVRINYCKRAMAEVCRDIGTYAGWAEDYARSGLAVHGIFFDETPNLYSATVATYLNTIDQTVKEMFGILTERLVSNFHSPIKTETLCFPFPLVDYFAHAPPTLGQVIHNPGTIPEATLANPGPDVAAVFEASFAEYRSPAIQERLSSLLPYKRNRCAFFVHSVPAEEVKPLVLELRHRGKYLFATDLRENFYVQFGPSWREFIAAMEME